MVERALCMREVAGSTPASSIVGGFRAFFLRGREGVGGGAHILRGRTHIEGARGCRRGRTHIEGAHPH